MPIWSRYEVVGREKHRHRAPREVVNSVNADELYIEGADRVLRLTLATARAFARVGLPARFLRKPANWKDLAIRKRQRTLIR